MNFSGILRLLFVPLLVATLVQAQELISDVSFGFEKTISPNSFGIPNWQLSGEGHTPQLMSDRVILTPPTPGGKRGSIWAENKVTTQEWTANFEFRATGPERGSGNIQIWYTKEGQSNIGTASTYTVGKFDGLVLVLDTHGSRGGSIRGFLNDGSTDYRNHHEVDGLAFGHCDYAYRNLGRPSRLQLKSTANSFEVMVDERSCFRSDKIKLPSEYSFGITAASAETPDSFEVFKFILTKPLPPSFNQGNNPGQTPNQQKSIKDDGFPVSQDRPASDFSTPNDQFSDLHNRLQVLNHALNNIFSEVSAISNKAEQRHYELLRGQNGISTEQFNRLENRIIAIEKQVNTIRTDIEGRDYKGHFDRLQEALRDTHTSITDRLPHVFDRIVTTSAPRMGFFVFVLIAFQLTLVVAYVWYKRRRANSPKKFL